jgi:hypothetical protein
MSTIITQYAPDAHLHPDEAARRRADRLAMASYDQIETALAYLSMIDPEAFEIALTGVTRPAADESEDDEAIPLCRTCGVPVGIFPELDLGWRHFRGDAAVSGAHQIFDPGHAPEVAWYLPVEAAEEF